MVNFMLNNLLTDSKTRQFKSCLVGAMVNRIGLKANEFEDYGNSEMFGLSSTNRAVRISNSNPLNIDFIEINNKYVSGHRKHSAKVLINSSGEKLIATAYGQDFIITPPLEAASFKELADFIYSETIKRNPAEVSVAEILKEIGKPEMQAILGQALLSLLNSSEEINKESLHAHLSSIDSSDNQAPQAIAEAIMSR